jgi:hypothetical protein
LGSTTKIDWALTSAQALLLPKQPTATAARKEAASNFYFIIYNKLAY